ncbi:hypothetical protein PTSG_07159 [Salpingoeca rosetta]|uniref:DENN domain-containing protein 11 n=1 Tax=Salpingoeca rosetta (strain ATCC 50818 / BSB-021) TaxID=946362 RepID=F2UE85_SALR5|nr:uncharacterized protein PTSG_07159 [Salpingoeca rosetta]EGD74935.1 hypothetical protein PTSG_07159 [Salpingoeca rosetta]|eukprot:XP_004992580.1 hypothetical protein PTSG_07159 [Salpingoeca rosetta]
MEAKTEVVAVFVVDFDALKGNSLRWQYPNDVELPFVEFKAMPSGSHSVLEDFPYGFLAEGMYMVSCFKTIKDAQAARGLRACSVGVVCTSPDFLHRHRSFLRDQCQKHLVTDDDDYSELKQYFEDQKAAEATNDQAAGARVVEVRSPVWNLDRSVVREAEHSNQILVLRHEEGSLSELVRRFGRRIMILWKLVLLQKRVMFLTSPPVDPQCQQVYACCALGSHTIASFAHTQARPFLYANLSDIPWMSTHSNYICCVTETVFELKTSLFDAFVFPDDKMLPGANVGSLLKLTAADKDRYKRLMLSPSDPHISVNSEKQFYSQEDCYIRFFAEMNNRIFAALEAASARPDRRITKEDVIAVGLSPQDDGPLLVELSTTYCPDLEIDDMASCSCA